MAYLPRRIGFPARGRCSEKGAGHSLSLPQPTGKSGGLPREGRTRPGTRSMVPIHGRRFKWPKQALHPSENPIALTGAAMDNLGYDSLLTVRTGDHIEFMLLSLFPKRSGKEDNPESTRNRFRLHPFSPSDQHKQYMKKRKEEEYGGFDHGRGDRGGVRGTAGGRGGWTRFSNSRSGTGKIFCRRSNPSTRRNN
jgi:hypothetical protein